MRNFTARIPLSADKWAYEQDESFALVARRHVARISAKWRPPIYFYHLRSGGHVAAVRHHLNSHFFAKIDLRRFFEQVTRNRIIKRLMGLGYSRLEAEDFAVASTIQCAPHRKKFVLPYGFLQSPLLASLDLDCTALGRQIAKLAHEGLCVSVYVDDIVVSGTEKLRTEQALADLRSAARQSNLEINDEKSLDVGTRMEAFNIEFGYGKMQISAERMGRFQQDILMFGNTQKALAIHSYIKSVNYDQAEGVLAAFPNQLKDLLPSSASSIRD